MRKFLVFVFFIFQIILSYAQPAIWGMTSSGGGNNAGVIFKTDGSGNNFSIEHDLYRYDGDYPKADLVKAADGKLYGMTSACCTFNGISVLFQYDPSTSTYTRKFYFEDTLRGLNPYGSLLNAADGMLYGMTCRGGLNDKGVIFQFNPVNSTYIKKLDFDGAGNGGTPLGSLLQTPDGKIYGMTSEGGANNFGVLFEYDPSNSIFTKKIDFDGTANGSGPHGSLIRASDGMLYGMTSSGGVNDFGVLFCYNPSTSVYTKLIDFNDTLNGATPYGALLQASDGKLYGMTAYGGIYNKGVLFQYNFSTGSYIKKFDFDSLNGENPRGSLMQASNGMMYGLTEAGGTNDQGVLFEYDPSASNFNKRLDFDSSKGSHPSGSLIQNTDGTLYGMTYDEGAEKAGTLFQYNPVTFAFSKKFDFLLAVDGSFPAGVLVKATDGKLYGASRNGGVNESGVIFQYDPVSSTYTKKFDFNTTVSGNYPTGFLIQASDGMLYGMTTYGGANDMGVIFQYDPVTSTYTKKFDFDNTASNPYGSFLQASDGKLYGVTREGGTNGLGTIFQYAISTFTFSKKFDFDGTANGKYPEGSLMQAADGKIYGTTREGGLNDMGVLFQYDPSNSAVSKKFDFDVLTGSYPEGNLVQYSNGKLYGMTSAGGINSSPDNPEGLGTLFQYDPANSVCVKKFDFDGTMNGGKPSGSLLKASDDQLYGLTLLGGTKNKGVLFQYNPSTLIYTKKFNFNGENGQYPDHTTLSEIVITASVPDINSMANTIHLYPNPSNGQITVVLHQKVNNATVKLFTLTGQMILEKINFSGDKLALNISEYESNIYLMEIIENGNISRIKVVKN